MVYRKIDNNTVEATDTRDGLQMQLLAHGAEEARHRTVIQAPIRGQEAM